MSKHEDDYADKIARGGLVLWIAICTLIYSAVFAGFVFITQQLLIALNQATHGALERNRVMGVVISTICFLIGCTLIVPPLFKATHFWVDMSPFVAAVFGSILGIIVGILIMYADEGKVTSAETTGDFTEVLELPPELYTPLPDSWASDAQPHVTELTLADIDALFAYPDPADEHVSQTRGSNGSHFR